MLGWHIDHKTRDDLLKKEKTLEKFGRLAYRQLAKGGELTV